MKNIRVSLKSRSYSIMIADSYQRLPDWLSKLKLSKHGCIVSHASILKRSGAQLLPRLKRAGWDMRIVTIPESETSKSLSQANVLLGQIARLFPMRVPVLFALGGGVVGDVTGFAAALYRRGVPYVQLPTTLLAQVDSSIGGKVGVDTPQAKNLLGAFYQPKLVWNHTGLLKTLPLRQRQSGISEIIKYGVIADAALFSYLEKHLESCLRLAPAAAQLMIERSCRIKARVVSQDERETKDIRATLNFGHTLGHALEAATGYTRLTHGEAIAIGMCAAAEMAKRLKLCPLEVPARISRLIRNAGLPVRARGVPLKKVKEALRFDKKFVKGKSRWVLPTRIGRVVVCESAPASLVDAVLQQFVLP